MVTRNDFLLKIRTRSFGGGKNCQTGRNEFGRFGIAFNENMFSNLKTNYDFEF